MITKTNSSKHSRRVGITLIEMLVTVTIMAMFAAIAWQRLGPVADQGRHAAAKAQIESFMMALQRYNLDHAKYPSVQEGLEAIQPYLNKEIPLDPWNNPFIYRYPGENDLGPEILCYGADGEPDGEGSAEDIVSWR